MTVPSAVVKFLASDNRTRVLAKPQLRGAEGADLELNLGDEIPVPSTVFGGLGAGGVNTIPISSFTYRTVGVNMSDEAAGDVRERDHPRDRRSRTARWATRINVAGQSLPTFGTRKVKTRMRLREGESNLLAGLVQRSGPQGAARRPRPDAHPDPEGHPRRHRGARSSQTDIVILLTPRIVRTHELTQEHLNPIYIGSQMNLGLSGPAPVIGAEPLPAAPPEPAAAAPRGATARRQLPINPSPTPGAGVDVDARRRRRVDAAARDPASRPSPPPRRRHGRRPRRRPTPADDTAAERPQRPSRNRGATAAPPTPTPQVTVTTPGPEFRVGGGPYTVPIAISNASRLSLMSVSLTYNPAVVRVRSVQEGPFFRQGGVAQSFNQQIDANAGRVDISVTRAGDQTGASGTGLLAALVFDAVASGHGDLHPDRRERAARRAHACR